LGTVALSVSGATVSSWRAVGSVIVLKSILGNIRMPRISGLRREKSSF
jgi:hypothetical protein